MRAFPRRHVRFCHNAASKTNSSIEVPAFNPRWREEFERRGYCHIKDFISLSTCNELVKEAKLLERSAFLSTEVHTIYQEEKDDLFASNHVRNLEIESRKQIIDFDRIPATSVLKQLYSNPDMVSLIQHIVSADALHLSHCPFNAGYYNIFSEGDGLGWHFDHSEFGVNLVLQQPDQDGGGQFEFHHNTRSPDDLWCFDKVAGVLSVAARGGDAATAAAADSIGCSDGDDGGVSVASDIQAGSLVVFNGRHSMHRVTPITGSGQRINVIYTYELAENVGIDEYSLQKFYGRTRAEAEAAIQRRESAST